MIPIIDNGHGGMINGKYQTKGKRSPKWADGTQLFEGECNRQIKARVLELLHFKEIPYFDLVPEQVDINLRERVKRANDFHFDHNRKTFLISIHSDAGGGHGLGSFISKNASRMSKSMAVVSGYCAEVHFPEARFRGIKSKNYYILKNTAMPALLLENFFMDNERDCKTYLLTVEGRDRIAAYIVDIIATVIKNH